MTEDKDEKEGLSLFDIAPVVDDASDFLKPKLPAKATAKDVQEQAKKTSKSIEDTSKVIRSKIKKVPGLEEVMEELIGDPELQAIREPPSLSEVRYNEEYSPILEELRSIVDRYKDGFRDDSADEDITRMAAFLTDLSEELAIFQAQSQDARSAEERMRNKTYVKAKVAALKNGARMTDADAKEIAKYMALEIAERAANLEFIEKYLYNAFHSLRNFVEILNFVTARRRRAEEKGAQY